jgi:hypothetical protein
MKKPITVIPENPALTQAEAAALYKILRETSLPADDYALVKGAIRKLGKMAEGK